MNKFDFFQRIKLLSNGALEVKSVNDLTDQTIYRPGSEKEFYENIRLDENGALRVYVIGTTPPIPPIILNALLLEDSFFFLLETGDKLLLN